MNTLITNPDFKNNKYEIKDYCQFDYFFNKDFSINDSQIIFDVDQDCTFNLNIVDFSLTSFKLNLVINLKKGSKVVIQVASICSNLEKKIYKIDVNHNEGNTYSLTKMAGINSKKGTLRFLGNSFIKNGASKSDTRQEGKITNLSKDCKSEVSPALLIDENDVKASHGAALGAYNPDTIYYMMSRGLSLDESKKLITFGNLLPIIESINNKEMIDRCKNILGELEL